ncbi:MAG TPA: hypothetical protein VH560_09605, partial [Polyangia bacterium]|nr:hypothetical protein [Polyangia bacterium]
MVLVVAFCGACSSSAKAPGGSGGAGSSGAAGAATGTAGASAGATGTAGAAAGASGTAGATAAAGASGAGTTGGAGADAAVAIDAASDATDAGISAIKGHPDPTKTYPTYPGFTLYLAEEFNAPIDLDKDPLWTWGDGTIDDGLARFGEDAITFADGLMKITVTQDPTPAGMSITKLGAAPGAMVGAQPLKSGEFRSKYNL